MLDLYLATQEEIQSIMSVDVVADHMTNIPENIVKILLKKGSAVFDRNKAMLFFKDYGTELDRQVPLSWIVDMALVPL